MLLVMLGGTLALLIVLVAWMRTPEPLFTFEVSPGTVLVHGGDSYSAAAGQLLRSILRAGLLLLAGFAGLVACRRDDHPDPGCA